MDARGYTRAFCLSSRFANATHLYAYTDKDTRRPVETLTPLAGALGLAIDTSVHRDDVDALAASIAASLASSLSSSKGHVQRPSHVLQPLPV